MVFRRNASPWFGFFSLLLLLLLSAGIAAAQRSVEKPLPLDGSIAPTGRAVELRWPEADPPRVGGIVIERRRLGETGGASWQAIAPAQPPVMQYVDTTTEPGVAYEYRVSRHARDIVDVGYWITGVDIPAKETHGTLYLVVEETVAPMIAARLDRLERDLIGSGWQVVRHQVPRHQNDPVQNFNAAAALRGWLQANYFSDPFGRHAVLLLGHVPIPMSGRAAPDGHDPVPHATDLFYADADGVWRVNQAGLLLENTVPGDAIEFRIGRVDFAQAAGRDIAQEVALLRSYLDKNHHWRHGMLGDPRKGYARNNNLVAERDAMRNIVGPDELQEGGHGDLGQTDLWLWGVDFGSHKANRAVDLPNRALFAINFGSHKQKFERQNNLMITLMTPPSLPLAVGWGGRPTWRLHHMALGGSIGEVHWRTVNNGRAAEPYRASMDYFPTGNYLWRNPVWVNLLGDPTLTAFPLASPGRLRLTPEETGVRLTWRASPDADVTGYRVYRAAPGSMRFEPLLRRGETITDVQFLDPEGSLDSLYMVRAHGLKDVYAGSFHTFSQGVFSDESPLPAPDLTVEAPRGAPVSLPASFTEPVEGVFHGVIVPPRTGQLRWQEGGWAYVPGSGEAGDVTLDVSASDGGRATAGRLRIILR
jgi:hypothetical protein